MTSSIDPLSKLAIALIWIAILSVCDRPVTLSIIASILLALLLFDVRVSPRRLLLFLFPFALFALSSAWIYALAPNTADFGGARVGWSIGALVGARIMTIGLVSVTFALTTNMADLARTLVQRARLPRRFVFGALAAIQFIPALADDARTAIMVVRAAASERSVNGIGRTIRTSFAMFQPGVALVLLAGAIRRAGAAAIAMEMRGLGHDQPQLTWRVSRFTRRDVAFIALALSCMACAWLAASP